MDTRKLQQILRGKKMNSVKRRDARGANPGQIRFNPAESTIAFDLSGGAK